MGSTTRVAAPPPTQRRQRNHCSQPELVLTLLLLLSLLDFSCLASFCPKFDCLPAHHLPSQPLVIFPNKRVPVATPLATHKLVTVCKDSKWPVTNFHQLWQPDCSENSPQVVAPKKLLNLLNLNCHCYSLHRLDQIVHFYHYHLTRVFNFAFGIVSLL